MSDRAAVLNELAQIQGSSAVLTAEAVLTYAANPDTALHSHFEWDDAKASHAYRLSQARQLIRVFFTVLDDGAGRDVPMRVYVEAKAVEPKVNGYEKTAFVLDDPFKRQELLLAIVRRMESIANSYPLAELRPVIKALSSVRSIVSTGDTVEETPEVLGTA
jgi:hypothetical protein